MYTVITEGNNVRQFSVMSDFIHARGAAGDFITLDNDGKKMSWAGNPITWPTDATNGLKAIVDVKAGTLRFAYDGWPQAVTEFVVSEYVAPVTIGVKPFVESVHILDHINHWPNPVHAALLQGEIFDDWRWWQDQGGGPWILRNDKENIEFHEGHWLNYHENKKKYAETQPAVTAASMLTAALGHMEDRAKTYDAPGGERSMGKTVSAFNTITGLDLTEEQGWLFMEILKQVRSQQGDYRADSYEDLVAYAALRGECAARERGNQS